jgi:hypothetical protein
VRCVQPSVLRPFYTTGWCEAANLGVIAAGGDAMVQCGVIPSIAHSTGVSSCVQWLLLDHPGRQSG